MGRVFVYGGHGFLPTEAFARGIPIASPSTTVIKRGTSLYGANDYEACEVCVVFGQKEPMNRVLADQRAHDTPVLVMDLGYIKRGNVPAARITPDAIYWSVNLNGLNGWGDPPQSPMPADRWAALQTPIVDWQPPGTHILVCGQKPHDAAIDGVNPRDWLQETVAAVRACTDAPIRWRPHPEDLSNRRLSIPGANITPSFTCPLADDLQDCAGVVAYNSNALVDALLAGVPIYPLGPGAVVPAAMGHTLLTADTLTHPLRPDRTQFFADLAYRQWTIPEMEAGLPWLHFFGPSSVKVESSTSTPPRRRPRKRVATPPPTPPETLPGPDFLSPEALLTTVR